MYSNEKQRFRSTTEHQRHSINARDWMSAWFLCSFHLPHNKTTHRNMFERVPLPKFLGHLDHIIYDRIIDHIRAQKLESLSLSPFVFVLAAKSAVIAAAAAATLADIVSGVFVLFGVSTVNRRNIQTKWRRQSHQRRHKQTRMYQYTLPNREGSTSLSIQMYRHFGMSISFFISLKKEGV